MAGLVKAVLVPSVISVAVKVQPPAVAVLKVTLRVAAPELSGVLAGRVMLEAEDVSAKVSLTELTKFQFASTAFTVTLKAVPAVCAVGVPVLPVLVPGALVSPGANNCSLAKAPALMGIEELVFDAFV